MTDLIPDKTMAEAVAFTNMVLTDLAAGLEEGYTYSSDTNTVETFMLAGNGPSAWAHFVIADDEVEHAYIEYADSGGTVLVLIPAHQQEALLSAFRNDAQRTN